MTEQQFLHELDRYLEKLSELERHDIRRDFIEYFENGRLEGKSTAGIIKSFGPIDELAEELLAAYEEELLINNASLNDTAAFVPLTNKSPIPKHPSENKQCKPYN